MTPEQVSLVQNSWKQVLPIKEQAAKLFYDRLFTIDPSLRSLFKDDLQEQQQKLMTMITTAVNGLNKLETIVPAVQQLGARHAKYGVKDANYNTVGTALLWTLEQGLGAAFTPAVNAAWAGAYELLATTMQQAAKEAH